MLEVKWSSSPASLQRLHGVVVLRGSWLENDYRASSISTDVGREEGLSALVMRSLRGSLRRNSALFRSYERRSTQRREARAMIERLAPYLARGRWRLLLWQKRPRERGKVRLLVNESFAPDAIGIDSLRVDGGVGVRLEPLLRLRDEHTTDAALPFHAHLIMPRYKDGKALLFDLHAAEVLRTAPSGFSESYQRLRDLFARHVASVPYRIVPGHDAIIEPVLTGPSLRQVPPHVAALRVCEILEQLPGLLTEASERTSGSRLAQAFVGLDPRSEVHRRSREILDWLGQAPMVPAHGDLALVNILDEDSAAVCIDFGDVCEQPAWFDPLKLTYSFFAHCGLPGSSEWSDRVARALEDVLRSITGASPPVDWRRLSTLTARELLGARDVAAELLDRSSAWCAPRMGQDPR